MLKKNDLALAATALADRESKDSSSECGEIAFVT